MIRPDVAKWGQTIDQLRELALRAPHPRTRERFLALYLIARGQTNATLWAAQIGRADETVLGWVHQYNQSGPTALTYRHTGGSAPFLHRNERRNSSTRLRPPIRSRTACPEAVGL